MKYTHRTLEEKFLRMNDFFKVLLVTGARQVGKTTMLRHLAEGTGRTYVTLDNYAARDLARRDPALFLQTYPPPVLIDEIQKAPWLTEQIKFIVDANESPGQFWLTGSQKFPMMKGIRESLAGRVGLLELYGLSQQEKFAADWKPRTLDFELEPLRERAKSRPFLDISRVFHHIWEGGLPKGVTAEDDLRTEYFNSYIETYLMRDVAEDGNVRDTLRFRRFLSAAAALAGEQLNYARLAEAAEISEPTARQWILLLEGLGVLYLLPPFSNNALKRLVKTPKLYFMDTGLCAFLASWLTPQTLMQGAVSGHYYENYLVLELVKQYAYGKNRAKLSYYRDSNRKEIDIIVEENGMLHPLEIKKASLPDRRGIKNFTLLDKSGLPRSNGGIICMCEEPTPIDEMNHYIPGYIL